MITEIILAGVSFFQPQTQQDSLGIETVNGKIFVVHKVSEKETLYGISKRYGATVDAVLQYNPSAASGLEIGQILKIPYTPKTTPVKPAAGGFVHVVAAKETMFSISKAYNISVDEIRQWNNLSNNSLSVGQELIIRKRNTQTESTNANAAIAKNTTLVTTPSNGVHVVEAKETMYSIARQHGITIDQLREWNKIEGNELKIGQSLVVANPAQQSNPVIVQHDPEPVKQDVPPAEPVKEIVPAVQTQTTPVVKIETPAVTSTINITETVGKGDEISEGGLAEMIEGTEGNRKYLALHRTAPVGTILKVKNEMNNREVFVRVTGKLQQNALNDKVVIKISKSAYDRLGAIDPRFRVQVTYYK